LTISTSLVLVATIQPLLPSSYVYVEGNRILFFSVVFTMIEFWLFMLFYVEFQLFCWMLLFACNPSYFI